MFATMTASKVAKHTPVPMSGVYTPTLLARINAVGVQPELAKRYGVSMRCERVADVAELASRHIDRVEAQGEAQANWLRTA